MAISNILKIGAIVLAGIALAFISGYIIFSYFSKDRALENTQLTNEAPVIEEDSEGITQQEPQVAGEFDEADSMGISPTAPTNNATKGGVLGETTNQDYNGIRPTVSTPQRNVIIEKEDDNDEEITYEEYEDNNDDSEVYVYGYPEIEEEDDYFEYTYTFGFNDDAQDRYEDGFDYSIDGETCDDDRHFTSNNYDFEGTIDSSDIEDEVEIVVRIEKDYINDEDDFDESDYKLDGEHYVVRGDIRVPHCED